MTQNKIGLIGAGMVGSSFAYSLVQSGLADELVLIDANHARAEGEALDLNHGISFTHSMKIYAGGYEDLKGAAITVIPAGAAQKPGETRLQLLEKNASIFKQIIPEVVKNNPDGLIVIATNPVDILTYMTTQISGLPANKIIGSGTILDTSRLRYNLGQYYGVDPQSVHAYVIGEHGDSELVAWSSATIAGIPLEQFHSAKIKTYNHADMEKIFVETRDAAYSIIEKKGATYYAIGLGLLRIVRAILRNEQSVLPVSSLMHGQYGLNDVCISLPTIVGRNGIEEVLPLHLTEEEKEKFLHSAQTLKEKYTQLK